MFMAFTHMVLRAKKQSQNRAEREREREKDTVNMNAQRDRDRRKRGKKCCWGPDRRRRRSSLSTYTENIETRLGNGALGHQCSVSDMNVWILTAPSYDTTTGQSALLSVTQAGGLTVCQHWLHVTAWRLKDHSGVFEFLVLLLQIVARWAVVPKNGDVDPSKTSLQPPAALKWLSVDSCFQEVES